jgi:hypothetical protein
VTCAKCMRKFQEGECTKHKDMMVFKCWFCCRPALFFCHGNHTYYCNECHGRWQEAQKGPWPSCDGTCPFAPHPPNGQQRPHGYCAACESEKKSL